jgi:hypothetical protein
MAARQWTEAQRVKQSAAIRTWQPWRHSTGAKSAAGKAIVSRNAYRGGVRPLCRFTRWVFSALKNPETLTPEIVEAAKSKSVVLLCCNAGYWAAALTKLITKCNFSESEVAELQELAKSHEDFKNSLMQ